MAARTVHIPDPALPVNAWVAGYVEECAAFPTGTHDDQVDTTTQALSWLYQPALREQHERAMASMNEMLSSTASDFQQTAQDMRMTAQQVVKDIDSARNDLKRAIVDLPEETRTNADAMRKVVADQIAALQEFARALPTHVTVAEVQDGLDGILRRGVITELAGMASAARRYLARRRDFASSLEEMLAAKMDFELHVRTQRLAVFRQIMPG